MARTIRSNIAAREVQASKIRRGIRAAQLRVALDKQRGRETPEAVVRISQLKMPGVSTVSVQAPSTRDSSRESHLAS